jgi:hypothetical protein
MTQEEVRRTGRRTEGADGAAAHAENDRWRIGDDHHTGGRAADDQ